MADDITGYIMGQMAADQRANSARIDAGRARSEADSAMTQANIARQSAAATSDRALLAMGFAQQQIAAWRARFERERATRRGWQQDGQAARALIQKLANVDKAGAQKLIDQAYAENKASIEASISRVDERNFSGAEPGKH